EPSWRALVARLAAALVLGIALLQLRAVITEHVEAGGRSALDAARFAPGPAPGVPYHVVELTSDVRTALRSRRYFETVLWPRLEAYPGLAKTLIARLLAQALDLGFRRIQFTPDLLPSDITGSFLYDQREGRFEFRPGPVFANLLLADEINRATPKTQAALLEA